MIIRSKADINQGFKLSYDSALKMLECGKQVEVNVFEFIPKRTQEQNNYYWLMCGEVALCLTTAGCSYGDLKLPYNSDLVHMINKEVFGIKTTTKMKIHEFLDFTTQFIQFWQERTNGEFIPSELPVSYMIKKGYSEKDLV